MMYQTYSHNQQKIAQQSTGEQAMNGLEADDD